MKKASCQSLVYIVNSYFFANNRCQLSVSMSTSSQSDYNRNYKYNCNEYSYKLYNIKSYNTIQHSSYSATCCLPPPPLNSTALHKGRWQDLKFWPCQTADAVSGGKMERLRAKRRCFSFWDLNRARKLFRSFHQTGLAHRVVSFCHVDSDAYLFSRVGLPRLPYHLLGLSSTLHHGTGVAGLVPLHAHLTQLFDIFDMVGSAANSNTPGTSTCPCTSKVDKPLRVATWVSKKNRHFLRGIGEPMSFWQSSNSHPWNRNTNHQCPRHGPRLFCQGSSTGRWPELVSVAVPPKGA